MGIDLESFVWPSRGIEPVAEEDVIYRGGDQPIAGFDNYVNWTVTTDVHEIAAYAEDHGEEHESGGEQEINLLDLRVGSTVQFGTSPDGTEFRLFRPGDEDDPWFRYDRSSRIVREWPTFATVTDHRDGLKTGGDITRRDGDVLYDHNEDWFHRAHEAVNAEWADNAGDAELLDGHPASAFLREDVDALVTGEWEFGQTIIGNLQGHASTSSFASVADWAEEAEWAETAEMADDSGRLAGRGPDAYAELDVDETVEATWEFLQTIAGKIEEAVEADWAEEADWAKLAEVAELAEDSELHEGWTVQEILDAAEQHAESVLPNVEDDGNAVVDDVKTLDFEQSIDVVQTAAGTARMSVTSVPHADESDLASDSELHEGWTVQEIIDAAAGAGYGRQYKIGEWTDTSSGSSDISIAIDNVFPKYRVVIQHENLRTTGTSDYSWMQVNQDTRNRYNYTKYADSGSTGVYEVHDTTSQSAWALAEAWRDKTTIAEYELVCKQPMVQNGMHPYLSEITRGGGTDGRAVVQYADLETEYTEVNHMRVYTNRDSALKITLFGMNE